MQSRVREQFAAVGRHVNDPRFAGRSGRWVEVDADGSIEQVGDRIWAEVARTEKDIVDDQGRSKPVGKLWR